MSIVCRESAVEYFKELVDCALAHQHVAADEHTAFYVVQLLAGFMQRRDLAAAGHAGDGIPRDAIDQALGVRLARALDAGGALQRTSLKEIGDSSLFISGFFADSLNRKLVDIDYYVTIGGTAYKALSRVESDTFAPIFAELAYRFVEFVEVLSEVSERSACVSNADLLRLYERWLRTGSRRSGQLLAERGVVPNSSLVSSRIQ